MRGCSETGRRRYENKMKGGVSVLAQEETMFARARSPCLHGKYLRIFL